MSFAYLIRWRNEENNSILAGVTFPHAQALRALFFSLPSPSTPATQASSRHDYQTRTRCSLRTLHTHAAFTNTGIPNTTVSCAAVTHWCSVLWTRTPAEISITVLAHAAVRSCNRRRYEHCTQSRIPHIGTYIHCLVKPGYANTAVSYIGAVNAAVANIGFPRAVVSSTVNSICVLAHAAIVSHTRGSFKHRKPSPTLLSVVGPLTRNTAVITPGLDNVAVTNTVPRYAGLKRGFLTHWSPKCCGH